MNLGIKKDLVAKAGIPINPPIAIDKPNAIFKSHIFPIAILENVEFVPDFETKDRQTDEVTKQPILRMTYKDTQNSEKKITDISYPLDPEDEKFEMKLDGLQKSIKHVFEEVLGADKFVEEDFAGTTFEEFFENVANAFNKHEATITIKKATKEDEKDVTKTIKKYTQVPMYLKLLYFNNRLSTPMFPNFVQRAYVTVKGQTTQVPCELSVGKKDAIVNKADAKPAANNTGARGAGFGAGAFGMADMDGAEDMVFPEDD